MEQRRGIFHEFSAIVRRFATLQLSRKLTDLEVVHVGIWLEDVLKWNFGMNLQPQVNEVMFLLHQLCSLVTLDQPGLVIKTSMAIEKLTCAHHVHMEGPTMYVAFDWCFAVMHQYSRDETDLVPCVHALRAVNAMFRSNPTAHEQRHRLLDETRVKFLILMFLRRAHIPERQLLATPLALIMSTIVTTFDVAVELTQTQRVCVMKFFVFCLQHHVTERRPRGDMMMLTSALMGVRALLPTAPWAKDMRVAATLQAMCRLYMSTWLHSPFIDLPDLDGIVPGNPFPEGMMCIHLNAPRPPYLRTIESQWVQSPMLIAPPPSPYDADDAASSRDGWTDNSSVGSRSLYDSISQDDASSVAKSPRLLGVSPARSVMSSATVKLSPGSIVRSPGKQEIAEGGNTPRGGAGDVSPGSSTKSAARILMSLATPRIASDTSGIIGICPLADLTYPLDDSSSIEIQTKDGGASASASSLYTTALDATLISSPNNETSNIVDVEMRSETGWSPGPHTGHWRSAPPDPAMETSSEASYSLLDRLQHTDSPRSPSMSSGRSSDIVYIPPKQMTPIEISSGASTLSLASSHKAHSPGNSSFGSLSEMKLSPRPDLYSSTPLIKRSPSSALRPSPATSPPTINPTEQRPPPPRRPKSTSPPDLKPRRPSQSTSPSLSMQSPSTSLSSCGPIMHTPCRSPRMIPYFIPEPLTGMVPPEPKDMQIVVIGDPPSYVDPPPDPIAVAEGMDAIPIESNVYPPDIPKDMPSSPETFIRQTDSEAREQALLLLQYLWQTVDDKNLFENFGPFVKPDSHGGMDQLYTHNLMSNLLKDESKNAEIAIACLQILFVRCKGPLFQHKKFPNHEAYNMKEVLEHLHHAFCLALRCGSTHVRMKVLRLMGTLTHNTDYSSLKKGLCEKVVRNVKKYIHHTDPQWEVLALAVINGILVHQHVTQIENALVLSNDQIVSLDDHEFSGRHDSMEFYADFESSGADEATPRSWLIERCFKNINGGAAAPVIVESLKIIGALCEGYFKKLIMPFLKTVAKSLQKALTKLDNVDVICHAAKAIEKFGVAMEKNYDLPGCLDESLLIWQLMLEAPLALLIGSTDSPVLRAGGADCIGSIGMHTFELLPSKVQLVCITTALSAAVDPVMAVRTAALRSISVLLTYPAARDFGGFVLDSADILLKAMTDENKTARLRASWGIGNVSEALVLDSVNNELGVWSDTGITPMLQRLITAAMDGCSANDRIRSNCVRALGNLLQMLNHGDRVESHYVALHEGVSALLRAAQQPTPLMKVRWNACYALGSVLKLASVYNDHLGPGTSMATRIFHALGWIIEGCPNLKVRVKAAGALLNCVTREGFGNEYIMLWGMLAIGLATLDTDAHCDEKYQREQLIEQTCVTLGHMTVLARPEDLEMLADVLSDGCHTQLVREVQFVYDRLRPNGCELMYGASRYVARMMEELTDAYQEQTVALKMLQEVFHDANFVAPL